MKTTINHFVFHQRINPRIRIKKFIMPAIEKGKADILPIKERN